MTTTPTRGDLRVWHIPQIPGRAFHVPVPDPATAALVIRALADYDAFQYRNHIKPDYSSASGLEVYDPHPEDDGDGWCEWYSTDGMDISEHLRNGDDPETLVAGPLWGES